MLYRRFVNPIALDLLSFPLNKIDLENEEDDRRECYQDDIRDAEKHPRINPSECVGKLHPSFFNCIEDVFQCIELK